MRDHCWFDFDSAVWYTSVQSSAFYTSVQMSLLYAAVDTRVAGCAGMQHAVWCSHTCRGSDSLRARRTACTGTAALVVVF
jgi:hypothetical protein